MSGRRRRQAAVRLAALLAALALASPGGATAQEAGPQVGRAQAGGFADLLAQVRAQALAAGVRPATVDAALAGLQPDPALMGRSTRQPEFSRPLRAYLADAAGAGRVARGRDMAARWRDTLDRVEAAYSMPREVVLALWAMETDFGRDQGARDVLRSLATLAHARPDGAKFRDELVAALVMLDRGVPRERLRGSWAGAMGNPQFLPSVYLRHAASLEGSALPDIWTSAPDSLASIATFLRGLGWRPGEPWGVEVALPPGYAFPAIRQEVRAFQADGLRRMDGGPLPGSGEALLFLPSGAGGPAFLLLANFFVLKGYNFSDSYALSVGVLADLIAGRTPIRTAWPAGEKLLEQADRVRLQQSLARLGFYRGEVDGRFGPFTRDAIHAFQRSVGYVPADGYPSAAVLARAAAAAQAAR